MCTNKVTIGVNFIIVYIFEYALQVLSRVKTPRVQKREVNQKQQLSYILWVVLETSILATKSFDIS